MPRRISTEEQERRLLIAAAQILQDAPPTSLTIEALVAAARVSRSTFYEVLGSTDMVIPALHRAVVMDWRRVSQHAEWAGTPLEELKRLVEAWLELSQRNGLMIRAALRTGAVPALGRAMSRALASWVEVAQRDGQLGEAVDPARLELAALLVVQSAELVARVPPGVLGPVVADVVIRAVR